MTEQNLVLTDLAKRYKNFHFEDELNPEYLYSLNVTGTPTDKSSENHWRLVFEATVSSASYIGIGVWERPETADMLRERFNCIDHRQCCEEQEEMVFEKTPELVAYIIETLKTPSTCEWFNLSCLETPSENSYILAAGHFGKECYAFFLNSEAVVTIVNKINFEDVGDLCVYRYERSKQANAIHSVLKSVVEDFAVRAVFLKGSLAKDEGDAYSDVDFYCLVDSAQEQAFLTRRMDHLNMYDCFIYHSEVNHVCPQIVGYYANDLHFDLYTVTAENIPHTGPIKVLHDPEGLLESYEAKDLSIAKADYWEYFDELTFILVEYEAAFMRGDKVWASRLAQHCSGYVAMIFRYLTDPEQARIGMKRLHKYNDPADHEALSEAMDLLGPSTSVKGLNMLLNIVADIIERYPETLKGWEHQYFFEHMQRRIEGLC